MFHVATAKGTADKVVESAKEREEKSRIINSKKMSLAKSKKEVHKKDSTGNITMETPHHSQPPFQPKQKSPEVNKSAD